MTGIEVTLGEWLLVCALGALVGLDGVSWPQAMWSRPIVAGSLGGLLFGGAPQGFLVGAWLEIVTGRHPPFGAARYPETGPAALLAGAAYALSDTGSLAALVTAVLVGWAVGWVGMHSLVLLRERNATLVADPTSFQGRPAEVVRRHRSAMRLDAGRAGLLAGTLFVPSVLLVRMFESVPAGAVGVRWTPVLAVVALAGLAGSGARSLGATRRSVVFLAVGGAIGAALAWALP